MKMLIATLLCAAILSPAVEAADWAACKKRKVEAVKLDQALRRGHKRSGYKSGAAMKRARREAEQWLWKNCRYHSRRLRDIERQMM